MPRLTWGELIYDDPREARLYDLTSQYIYTTLRVQPLDESYDRMAEFAYNIEEKVIDLLREFDINMFDDNLRRNVVQLFRDSEAFRSRLFSNIDSRHSIDNPVAFFLHAFPELISDIMQDQSFVDRLTAHDDPFPNFAFFSGYSLLIQVARSHPRVAYHMMQHQAIRDWLREKMCREAITEANWFSKGLASIIGLAWGAAAATVIYPLRALFSGCPESDRDDAKMLLTAVKISMVVLSPIFALAAVYSPIVASVSLIVTAIIMAPIAVYGAIRGFFAGLTLGFKKSLHITRPLMEKPIFEKPSRWKNHYIDNRTVADSAALYRRRHPVAIPNHVPAENQTVVTESVSHDDDHQAARLLGQSERNEQAGADTGMALASVSSSNHSLDEAQAVRGSRELRAVS